MIRHRSVPILAVASLLAVTATALATDGEHSKVLGSVHIDAGEHTDDATSVNGSVEIGANAVVKRAETVNGSITMREHSTVDSAKTVNGGVDLGDGARVAGDAETVNGHLSLGKGADVAGHLSNVNGNIQLEAAHVGGGIETTNGDIDIGANSRVEGGILVNKSSDEGWFHFGTPKPRRVVIGPGTVVKGTLRFEGEVKLYVSDRATIGPVEGATVNKFSGNSP